MFVLLRLISLILVVSAIMLLGADIVTSLENGGHIMVRSLDAVWALADKPAMLGFHAWCDHRLPAFLAHGIAAVFGLPGWGVTGVPGIILAFLFGRRTADVG
ncbi:MAG TPA: hypothetical protein VG387_09760 [Rhizomicrobium sp.]|jgi:hypothetical protein|nr:hypothetical protein [Rhizomicrobium sp.]